MNAHLPPPSIALKNAVSSLRTVGTVFILVGTLFDLIALSGPGLAGQGVEAAASASTLLLAPGIIYHLSATFIRRHDVKIAVLAQRTAILQSMAGVADVTWLAVASSRSAPAFLFGGVPILFFIPALLAQAYEIAKALHALRRMPQAQRGFEVLAVLPIEEEIADGVGPVQSLEPESSAPSGTESGNESHSMR